MGARNRGGLSFAAQPVMNGGVMGDLQETMRFDPDDGIPNLDEHLDRLKAAADSQGFKFDRHAARNELQAATFGRRGMAVARLLLSPTGAMAIELKAED